MKLQEAAADFRRLHELTCRIQAPGRRVAMGCCLRRAASSEEPVAFPAHAEALLGSTSLELEAVCSPYSPESHRSWGQSWLKGAERRRRFGVDTQSNPLEQ